MNKGSMKPDKNHDPLHGLLDPALAKSGVKKDESELLRDSFIELLKSLASTAGELKPEQMLERITSIAEGIEEAERRDAIFAEKFAGDLVDYFEFQFREKIPALVGVYEERIDEQERLMLELKSATNAPQLGNDKPQLEKKSEKRIEGLRKMIEEIERIINVKKDALKEPFDPVLKRAKDLFRRMVTLELKAYEQLVIALGKIPNDILRKRRLDRANSTYQKFLLQAELLASRDPEFREMTYRQIMRNVEVVLVGTREALMEKMKVARPKPSRLPVILLAGLISILAGGSVARWHGIRLQDVFSFIGMNDNESLPQPTTQPIQPPISDTMPKGQIEAEQNKARLVNTVRSSLRSELNPERLTQQQCEQEIRALTATDQNGTNMAALSEWNEKLVLIVILQELERILGKIERSQPVQVAEIDLIVNPDGLKMEDLNQLQQTWQRPEFNSHPQQRQNLERLARFKRVIAAGEAVKSLLSQ